ncbi:hypothetical protein G8A07_14345 [Roseateles sp. DAIF2]|uniref:hypothetical protein n=1 Tax=Roseateles sp. DAIF2 TaxID=2714952 RepID=UPI0018A2591E|nr:hypothetical protein [Roseateles sp. DAIF2]QPF73978.1 hypothetical protein G8A07_14345 [Roseateles sp. DAIF2]
MNGSTVRAADQCIYCGAKGCYLSKEHVLALALGGKQVLHRASCPEHAQITSELERRVARGTYGFQRAIDGVATRRSKQRADFLAERVRACGVNHAGEEVSTQVPRSQTPRMPIASTFPVPGLLAGRSPEEEATVGMETNLDTDQSSRVMRSLGWKEILWHSPGMNARDVARVLAKTAHAFAWYELGGAEFVPLLLPLIVRDEGSCTYWVGGFEPRRSQLKTPVALREIDVSGTTYLIADISMMALPHLPLYQVVVGLPGKAT